MLEQLVTLARQEASLHATRVMTHAKRKILLFVLKTVFLVLGLFMIAVGIVLLGAKYVGSDLMLLLVGALLFLGFLLVK